MSLSNMIHINETNMHLEIINMENITDIMKLERQAICYVTNGEHKNAFDLFRKVIHFDKKNHFILFDLSEYLFHGITGYVIPDKHEACMLLIEACWLEMEESLDEGDDACSTIKKYSIEVFKKLKEINEASNKRRPLPEYQKQELVEMLFDKVKVISSNPFVENKL
jgi:hypothetical protein